MRHYLPHVERNTLMPALACVGLCHVPKRDKLRGRTRQAVAAKRDQRSSMPAGWVLGGAKRKRSLFLCPGQRFLTRTHPFLCRLCTSVDIVSCVNGTDSSDQRCACPQSDTCTSCTLQVRRLSREHCVYWPTVEPATTPRPRSSTRAHPAVSLPFSFPCSPLQKPLLAPRLCTFKNSL